LDWSIKEFFMSFGIRVSNPGITVGAGVNSTKASLGAWNPSVPLSSKPGKKIQNRAKVLKQSKVKAGGVTPIQSVIPAGFAFIMLVGETMETAQWQFVTFEYGRTLGTSSQPFSVFKEITNEMHRFWKRVVIDGSFQANERGMWMRSMKLVEVHQSAKDVTERLFGEEEAFKDSMRLGAMSKLSPQEAKLLGLETEYTMLRLIQTGPRETEDDNLASTLRDSLCALGLDKSI
jgi:hypothetical protein